MSNHQTTDSFILHYSNETIQLIAKQDHTYFENGNLNQDQKYQETIDRKILDVASRQAFTHEGLHAKIKLFRVSSRGFLFDDDTELNQSEKSLLSSILFDATVGVNHD